jgi:hypothetical protein
MTRINRRTALAAVAVGPASALATPALADLADRTEVEQLWRSFCKPLRRTRIANMAVPGKLDGSIESRQLDAVKEQVLNVVADTPARRGLKMAFWKWYRNDFWWAPGEMKAVNRAMLQIYDAMIGSAGIDFDGIATEVGLLVLLPSGQGEFGRRLTSEEIRAELT